MPGPSSVGEPGPSGAAKAEPSGEGKARPSGAPSDGVANAERELEKFIAKHPLSPDATAHFIELLRTIIPDSDILKQCTFENIKIPKEYPVAFVSLKKKCQEIWHVTLKYVKIYRYMNYP